MSTVVIENHGYVRVLRINRPEAKNAFNRPTYLALASAITEADRDRSVRVLLITGTGDSFSAGQDLAEMTQLFDPSQPVAFEQLVDALVACGKPVVTAVNGLAVGIGTTMLLHTDVNYLGRSARFRCPFTSLAVVPEAGSSFLLPKLCGTQKATEFLLRARWWNAEEAFAAGLGLAVVDDAALVETALAAATELAKLPPASVRETKRLMRADDREAVRAARARENQAFMARLESAEMKEAIKAFFEKRAPNFEALD